MTSNKHWLTMTVATFVLGAMIYSPTANAVVPNDDNEGEAAVDTEGGVNGVGMFFRSDGSVCTGTLINPRTVLFAAHCVNNRPETDYGTAVASAFSFNVDALPGFQDWFANGFTTNADLNVFNISQIQYHPDSLLNPQARGFLEADIALATLDTPASEIPTWALLFSALPGPDQLDPVTGTGYHVDISGYGRTGNGTFGDFQGIDFRRRAAENMLGALASIDDRDAAIFGPGAEFLPQNVYWTDFDDPESADPFDFNLFLDEPLDREGTTAGGDSGGPLILDAANNEFTDIDIQIGVLSGGGGFFGNFSAYGEFSIYQPLYLFADYIAETNPYRYVSAVGGDGDWEDASHWQTETDPNYYIIDDTGAIVNGFPDEQPDGINGTDGDFGGVCVDFFPREDPQTNACTDLATGGPANPPPSGSDGSGGSETGGQATLRNNVGTVNFDLVRGNDVISSGDNSVTLNGGNSTAERNVEIQIRNSSDNSVAAGPLPDPTIDNGLPGATDFVPNNIDPDAAANTRGRYFDVTLSNSGTTTLSSEVEIDRLTLSGGNLTVSADGDLMSLIDIQQMGGMTTVDGRLASLGDYLLMTGLLSGSGTVETPFLTSVAGMIAPGGLDDIGTLTIDGSAVFSSGSTLLINLGANGVNDRLLITGDSSLGGQVLFGASSAVRAGNEYTFLTTSGSQTGELTTAPISALLTPVLNFAENSVSATIVAGSVTEVIDASNPVQSAYATLLDQARSVGGLDTIFASLDLASASEIQSLLDDWAPSTEATVQSVNRASAEHLVNFHKDRLSGFKSKNWGGKVTMMGQPVLLASNADNLDAVSSSTLMAAGNSDDTYQTATIPDDFEIFLSAGFIDGEGQALRIGNATDPKDSFDGWSVSAGIEHRASDKVSVGASITYMDVDSDGALGQTTQNDYLAGSVYGQLRTESQINIDGLLSLGSYGIETLRSVALPSGGSDQLTSDDDSLALIGELQISRDFEKKSVVLTPRASLRTTVISLGDIVEQGGPLALAIDRDSYSSTQSRIGLQVGSKGDSALRVRVSGDWVNELNKQESSLSAGFASVNGPSAIFPVVSQDEDWFEVGGSIGFGAGQTRIDLSATTTVDRSDLDAQSYRARISYKF